MGPASQNQLSDNSLGTVLNSLITLWDYFVRQSTTRVMLVKYTAFNESGALGGLSGGLTSSGGQTCSPAGPARLGQPLRQLDWQGSMAESCLNLLLARPRVQKQRLSA